MKRQFLLYFLTICLSTIIVSGSVQSQYKIKLNFSGAYGADKDSLWVGFSASNTRCQEDCGIGFPTAWCEPSMPPIPPGETFYSYFISPCSEAMYPYDLRSFIPYAEADTFHIRIAGDDVPNGPVTISWSPDLCAYGGVWELRKKSGSVYPMVIVDLCKLPVTSYTYPNAEAASQLDFLLIRRSNCTSLSLCPGWNLVSIPREQPNYDANVLFPGKFGSVYGYCCAAGYCEVTNLELGKGYWVYYTASATVTLCGDLPGGISILLCQGWNLIGSRSVPTDLSSLVISGGAIMFGDAFRYNCGTGGYESTTVIYPYEAVWIYVTADCVITYP